MQKDHSDYFIERVKSKSETIAGSPLNPQILKFADGTQTVNMGLTKREYFAAMAMQGLLTRVPKMDGVKTDLGIMECRRISDESVIMADALIEALNK